MKKQIAITGYPLSPITVGESACVRELEGDRITSTVQNILERDDGYILFETLNTIYHLKLENIPIP